MTDMRKRRKYDSPEANKWVYPKRRGYRLRCCDCGLVHEVDFRVTSRNRVEVRFRRDNRATAQTRVRLGLRKNKDGSYRTGVEQP